MAQGVISTESFNETPDQAEQKFLDGKAAMLFLSDGQASSYGAQHNMTVRPCRFSGTLRAGHLLSQYLWGWPAM